MLKQCWWGVEGQLNGKGGVWLPDNFLIVQVDLRGLGQLLGAGAVTHLLVQEFLGSFQLRLQHTSNQLSCKCTLVPPTPTPPARPAHPPPPKQPILLQPEKVNRQVRS